MFEGQNIHLSPIDGKRLCSFSRKICKQRRLNGYAFCIRHILEDTNSPFKQCQFKIRTNGEQCFNPVPVDADRIYCNSHLQVLGLLPKKVATHKKSCVKTQKSKKTAVKAKLLNAKAIVPPKKITTSNSNMNTKKQNINSLLTEPACTKGIIWNNRVKKISEQRRLRLEEFKLQTLSNRIDALRNSPELVSDLIECKKYHTIDEQGQDQIIEAFQTTFLSNSERVHHNILHVDSMDAQESKVLSKIRHQYAQLRCILRAKLNSRQLSYSVLSKLIASVRENSLQTASVLVINQATDENNCSLFRDSAKNSSYIVPCCLISDNVRCTNAALPYMKFCKDHITEDQDQLLFASAIKQPTRRSSSTSLGFLQLQEQPQCGKKNDLPSTQGKQKQRKAKPSASRPGSVKKVRLKKAKSVGSLKTQIRKKFAVPMKPLHVLNAHVNMKKVAVVPSAESKAHDRQATRQTDEIDASGKSHAESSSDDSSSISSTDSDNDDAPDDPDTLTPEEAFHLPPGSLSSFPVHIDDEDSLSAIRRSCELDDDEEDELIRSSFVLDTSRQISRELSSPTLNQLSSSDFDSNFDNLLLSPAKVSAPCGMATSSSSLVAAFSAPETPLSSTNQSLAFLPTLISPQRKQDIGLVTSLKISPVTAKTRMITFNKAYTTKPAMAVRSMKSNINCLGFEGVRLAKEIPTAGLSNGHHHHNDVIEPNFSSNEIIGQMNIARHSEPGNTCDNMWSKRLFNDSLLTQVSHFNDPELFTDIQREFDAPPLEKVNPDIFFSSVFPVVTSTANI